MITLNVDFDDEGEPSPELIDSVKSMLAKQNVRVETLMSSDPFESVLEEYDIFSLPAAVLFDQDGNQIKRFEGIFSYATDVAPFIGPGVQ